MPFKKSTISGIHNLLLGPISIDRPPWVEPWPSEDDAEQQAAIQAAKDAEEKQKREIRAAIAIVLTDPAMINQLSSSGIQAQARRRKEK